MIDLTDMVQYRKEDAIRKRRIKRDMLLNSSRVKGIAGLRLGPAEVDHTAVPPPLTPEDHNYSIPDATAQLRRVRVTSSAHEGARVRDRRDSPASNIDDSSRHDHLYTRREIDQHAALHVPSPFARGVTVLPDAAHSQHAQYVRQMIVLNEIFSMSCVAMHEVQRILDNVWNWTMTPWRHNMRVSSRLEITSFLRRLLVYMDVRLLNPCFLQLERNMFRRHTIRPDNLLVSMISVALGRARSCMRHNVQHGDLDLRQIARHLPASRRGDAGNAYEDSTDYIQAHTFNRLNEVAHTLFENSEDIRSQSSEIRRLLVVTLVRIRQEQIAESRVETGDWNYFLPYDLWSSLARVARMVLGVANVTSPPFGRMAQSLRDSRGNPPAYDVFRRASFQPPPSGLRPSTNNESEGSNECICRTCTNARSDQNSSSSLPYSEDRSSSEYSNEAAEVDNNERPGQFEHMCDQCAMSVCTHPEHAPRGSDRNFGDFLETIRRFVNQVPPEDGLPASGPTRVNGQARPMPDRATNSSNLRPRQNLRQVRVVPSAPVAARGDGHFETNRSWDATLVHFSNPRHATDRDNARPNHLESERFTHTFGSQSQSASQTNPNTEDLLLHDVHAHMQQLTRLCDRNIARAEGLNDMLRNTDVNPPVYTSGESVRPQPCDITSRNDDINVVDNTSGTNNEMNSNGIPLDHQYSFVHDARQVANSSDMDDGRYEDVRSGSQAQEYTQEVGNPFGTVNRAMIDDDEDETEDVEPLHVSHSGNSPYRGSNRSPYDSESDNQTLLSDSPETNGDDSRRRFSRNSVRNPQETPGQLPQHGYQTRISKSSQNTNSNCSTQYKFYFGNPVFNLNDNPDDAAHVDNQELGDPCTVHEPHGNEDPAHDTQEPHASYSHACALADMNEWYGDVATFDTTGEDTVSCESTNEHEATYQTDNYSSLNSNDASGEPYEDSIASSNEQVNVSTNQQYSSRNFSEANAQRLRNFESYDNFGFEDILSQTNLSFNAKIFVPKNSTPPVAIEFPSGSSRDAGSSGGTASSEVESDTHSESGPPTTYYFGFDSYDSSQSVSAEETNSFVEKTDETQERSVDERVIEHSYKTRKPNRKDEEGAKGYDETIVEDYAQSDDERTTQDADSQDQEKVKRIDNVNSRDQTLVDTENVGHYVMNIDSFNTQDVGSIGIDNSNDGDLISMNINGGNNAYVRLIDFDVRNNGDAKPSDVNFGDNRETYSIMGSANNRAAYSIIDNRNNREAGSIIDSRNNQTVTDHNYAATTKEKLTRQDSEHSYACKKLKSSRTLSDRDCTLSRTLSERDSRSGRNSIERDSKVRRNSIDSSRSSSESKSSRKSTGRESKSARNMSKSCDVDTEHAYSKQGALVDHEYAKVWNESSLIDQMNYLSLRESSDEEDEDL